MTSTNTNRLKILLHVLGEVTTNLDQLSRRLPERLNSELSPFESHILNIAKNELMRCMDQVADQISTLEIESTDWGRV